MRFATVLLLIFGFTQSLSGQIIPVQNGHGKLIALGIKSCSTSYSPSDKSEEYLIYKENYNAKGLLVSKVQLSLWEVVSYKNSYSYTYDSLDRLTEEWVHQEFLELFDRDTEFLESFGRIPLNKKITYAYNVLNQLCQKKIYTFGLEDPSETTAPDQTISYTYQDSLLVEEESISSDEKFFNKNYLIQYSHDSLRNLVQKVRLFGKERALQRTTTYQYNEQKLAQEERTIDSSIPHNNTYFKYEYDDDGKMTGKFIFNLEEMEFELDTSYEYDEHGNAISGDRNVSFEYDDQGLIISEAWTDPVNEEQIILRTSYSYF